MYLHVKRRKITDTTVVLPTSTAVLSIITEVLRPLLILYAVLLLYIFSYFFSKFMYLSNSFDEYYVRCKGGEKGGHEQAWEKRAHIKVHFISTKYIAPDLAQLASLVLIHCSFFFVSS